MDDEQLGRAIAQRAILYTNLFDGEQYERLGAAARELLAKPVATREGVEKWAVKTWAEIEDHGWRGFSDGVLVALSHFAPPARPRMMIEGMSVEEILAAMDYELGVREAASCICAAVAHHLATTAAPEVDPDAEAEAKRLAWEHAQCFDAQPPGQEAAWDCCNPKQKDFWRKQAAKKEAGGE